jgi:beta-N-acetylhexosaminidase
MMSFRFWSVLTLVALYPIMGPGVTAAAAAPAERKKSQQETPLVPFLKQSPGTPESVPPKLPEEKPEAPAATIEPLRPDLVHMVSQLMMVTLEGKLRPNHSDIELLTKFTPGAVLIQNITSMEGTAEYITILRALPLESKLGVPLLIGTDLSTVMALSTSKGWMIVQLPPLLSLAAISDVGTVADYGGMMAEQLTAMGFNFHLGPTLALAPDMPGTTGTVHCLGSDPVLASETGCALLRALEEKKMIAIPMGFPGGAANRLPREPAVLLTPKSTLAAHDMLPYASAIKAGAHIIHVGNTLVPTIDPSGVPASTSKIVINDLLRDLLQFKGVVVAGPMDAIQALGKIDSTEASIRAIEAGADLMMWNKADQRVMNTILAIVNAIHSGRITEERIKQSYQRIVEFKKQYGLLERPLPKPNAAAKLVRADEQPEIIAEIFRRSITLIKNDGGVLPLTREGTPPIGITGTVDSVDPLMDLLQKRKIRPIQRQRVLAKYDGQIHDFDIERILRTFEGARTVVCLFTGADRTATIEEVIGKLKRTGAKVIAVLLGYPNNLPALARADAIMLVYSAPTEFEQNIEAVVDILLGAAPIAIKPRARDVQTSAGKIELFRAVDVIHSPTGILPLSIGDEFKAGLSASYDVASFLKRAEWDFGDGKHGKGLEIQRAYEKSGKYDVTVSVTTDKGDVATGQFRVLVE